jgi:hypothetical protein
MRSLGKPKHRWDDNIKTVLKEQDVKMWTRFKGPKNKSNRDVFDNMMMNLQGISSQLSDYLASRMILK